MCCHDMCDQLLPCNPPGRCVHLLCLPEPEPEPEPEPLKIFFRIRIVPLSENDI